MDYLQSFAISAAGMTAERTRVEVAALNLARANTALPPGSAMQTLRVVAGPATMLPPSSAWGFDRLMDAPPSGPSVRVEPVDGPPRQVLEPGHPLANAQGMVSYPAVDTTFEMVTILTATRAYEANVAAMNSARAIALKTLEIGSGS